MAQKTASSADLTWLLDDLVGRVKQAEHAVVLSTDGLLMAASQGLSRDDAEHLAAIAAGIQSLARGAGKRFGGGAGAADHHRDGVVVPVRHRGRRKAPAWPCWPARTPTSA